MACKKYTVTNNNTETVTFAYQKCSNTVWVYDATVAPGQTKSVWLIDNTFSSPPSQPLDIIDDGSFPPASTITGPCTDPCDPILLYYNTSQATSAQVIYSYDINAQYITTPYYLQSPPLNAQSNSTIVKYRGFITQVTDLPNGNIFFDNYGVYFACPLTIYDNYRTQKNYPFPRQNTNITYGITEESWMGEDTTAKEILYLTGNTITASTGTVLTEIRNWSFPANMNKVVGQVKTFFSFVGIPRLWTMYQTNSGGYTLVRNLWTDGTQELLFNMPSNFNVNGEKPIGLFLNNLGQVRIYTSTHNVYLFVEGSPNTVVYQQTCVPPLTAAQGWQPIWLSQPWSCDIPPTPSPSATPTPTPTPTITQTSTPTPTITQTSTPTPTITQTSTPTPSTSLTPSVTQTSTQTPTPTPSPTCPFGDCFHYVSVTLTGSTQISFDLCYVGGTQVRNLSSSSYPATLTLGPTLGDDCYSGNSYTVLSGSEPISVDYFNPCCDTPVTPTPTSSETPTPTPTPTSTVTPTVTQTSEPTTTPTPTSTTTPTPSVTTTVTPTTTSTITPTPSITPSITPSSTPAPCFECTYLYTGTTGSCGESISYTDCSGVVQQILPPAPANTWTNGDTGNLFTILSPTSNCTPNGFSFSCSA
jgi:hypothetical protein